MVPVLMQAHGSPTWECTYSFMIRIGGATWEKEPPHSAIAAVLGGASHLVNVFYHQLYIQI